MAPRIGPSDLTSKLSEIARAKDGVSQNATMVELSSMEQAANVCESVKERQTLEDIMAWTTPVIEEVCLGMEVTTYESAEIDG